MIKMNINVKAYPRKLPELLQTLNGLMDYLRREQGNLSYRYLQDDQDTNTIHIQAKWSNWEKLESHLQSNFFGVLLGTLRVLCEEPEVQIDNGTEMLGMEAINKAQKKKRSK